MRKLLAIIAAMFALYSSTIQAQEPQLPPELRKEINTIIAVVVISHDPRESEVLLATRWQLEDGNLRQGSMLSEDALRLTGQV